MLFLIRERRRGCRPRIDAVTELGKESLQPGRHGGAEQACRDVAGITEGVGRVGWDVDRLPAHRRTGGSSRSVTSTEPSTTWKHSSNACRCAGGPPPAGISMSISAKRPAVCSPESNTV